MITRRQSILVLPSFVLAGCVATADKSGMLRAATNASKAMSLTDDEVRGYASQMAKKVDAEAKIAPVNNKYSQRLNTLTSSLQEDKGLRLNYKVYLTPEVNAFAMADGTIRFYSGLMDMMTDDEIRYVIGHEIGHVHSGHTKKRMQTALSVSAAQTAAASSGNAQVATLASSELGDLIAKVVKAQHSQSNENEADDYAMEFMSRRNYQRRAAVTALEKLDKLSGGRDSNWLSTHPAPKERAARMSSKLA